MARFDLISKRFEVIFDDGRTSKSDDEYLWYFAVDWTHEHQILPFESYLFSVCTSSKPLQAMDHIKEWSPPGFAQIN